MGKFKVVTGKKTETTTPPGQEIADLKLTRAEIVERVKVLRAELEAAKRCYDGALFDSYRDGVIPPSLDTAYTNHEPYDAVYYLSPLLQRMVENLQNGNSIKQSDDVFELYLWSTQTAYMFGMLSGVIYANCPTATIDRFERGLITALAACHWIVKDGAR